MQYSAIKPEDRGPDERRLREIEYFQGFYPDSMKELQSYVAAECDKMDYPNSPMYDEYPDRVMMNQLCRNVCCSIPEEVGRRLWGDASVSDLAYDGTDVEEVEIYEVLKGQQMNARRWGHSGPGPQRPPQGPPPWGPPPGPRPPQGPPPWGPPPGPRPPQGPPPWGPPPGPRPPQGPPPWGPPPRPPRPPQGPPPWGRPPGPGRPNWTDDIVRILLLNEMQRRRCKNGRCF